MEWEMEGEVGVARGVNYDGDNGSATTRSEGSR